MGPAAVVLSALTLATLADAHCPARSLFLTAAVQEYTPSGTTEVPGTHGDTYNLRTYGRIEMGEAYSVNADGSGPGTTTQSTKGSGWVTVQCPLDYEGSFEFPCPHGANAWGDGYTVPEYMTTTATEGVMDCSALTGAELLDGSGTCTITKYHDIQAQTDTENERLATSLGHYNADGIAYGASDAADPAAANAKDDVVTAKEAMEAITAAADRHCKLINNFDLKSSLSTDDASSALMRCDINSVTPGVSFGEDYGKAGSVGGIDCTTFSDGEGETACHTISNACIFRPIGWISEDVAVAPSTAEACVPVDYNPTVVAAAGADGGGSPINDLTGTGIPPVTDYSQSDLAQGDGAAAPMSGVQMSRQSLPVTVAYKSGVALSDTPTDVGDGIYEPIADYKGFKHAAATMMRTDTGTDAPPLQGGGARMWKQMKYAVTKGPNREADTSRRCDDAAENAPYQNVVALAGR